MKMLDPCGPDIGYRRIVAIFLKQLFIDHNCRSATLKGYAGAVNELFIKRELPIPADISDKDNMSAKLYLNLKKEEDICRKRHPLNAKIYAKLHIRAQQSHRDSEISVTFDWYTIIKVSGYRSIEFAQKVQTKIQTHRYPSGREVTMAFIRKDWVFFDNKGHIITQHSEANLEILGKFRAKHRIQKNRQNGQEITIVADTKNPKYCPCRAAYRIFLRSIRCGQTDDEPMGIFVNKANQVKYLTANKINEVLRDATRDAHPTWPETEVFKISSHSGRIWALMLLAEAGQKSWFLKARLRWLGDSFRHYLRDTATISENHQETIEKFSDEVNEVLGNNISILPNEVPEEQNMGTYLDDMD